MLFEINLLTIIVMAALGGISTYLANQNIAVFHDGLRPLYSQYFSGAMDRRALFATSFALSFGLVIGFGIPTSIAGKIIIVHTILLGCDILGTLFSDSGNRKWIATAVGALFGILLLFGMQAITDIFSVLPIDFTGNLGNVGSLIIVSFSVFPAIAVGYQAGLAKGAIVLALTMIIKQFTALYGRFSFGTVQVALNADGMALLFGIVAMVFVAARYGKKSSEGTASAFAVFGKNIERIRKNIVVLSIAGGIVAIATTLLLIAEGPASLTLTAEGQYASAAMVALGRTLGFIP